MSRRGLGKGIDAILPSDFSMNRLVPGVTVTEIDLSDITPNPEQPRRTISEDELNELSQSIAEHGVLQPILVSKSSSGYVVIAGERRYRASKKAGLKTIPGIVREFDDLQQLEVALIENMQREDLSPIEQAMSVKRLNDDFGQTYEQIAKRLGRAYASVANMVRLLKLPEHMQTALNNGDVSEGHARALLALADHTNEQENLLRQVIDQKWSVRRAEQYVKEVKTGQAKDQKVEARASKYIEDSWTKKATKKLGSKVLINPTAKGGFIKIEYKNSSELEKLKDNLFN